MELRIKDSIDFYNNNIRLGDEPKMNQKRLSYLIYGDALPVGQSEIRLSKFKTGRSTCSFEILMRIAEILHVTSDYLLGLSEQALGESKPKKEIENVIALRSICNSLEMIVTFVQVFGITSDFILGMSSKPFGEKKILKLGFIKSIETTSHF